MASRHQGGATAVELVVALLVVLLLGLAVFQLVLLYQARLAIEQAAVEAARSGSTGHASDESMRRGLARGLAPLMFGASDAADLQVSEARALVRIVEGQAEGAIVLRRLSPTDAAFRDWEEVALDPMGEPIAGQMEIPNDNLDSRRRRSAPATGVAGYRGDEPIGSASGLTLVDANLLRVELVYGVRLSVPIAGRLFAMALSGWQGCDGGAGGSGAGPAQAELCPHLMASPPRLPLRAVATVRMMSPARRASGAGGPPSAGAGGSPPAGGQGGGPGTGVGTGPGTGPGDPGAIAVNAGANPGGAPPGSTDGQATGAGEGAGGGRGEGRPGSGQGQDRLADGFLGIGSNRSYPHPGLCSVAG